MSNVESTNGDFSPFGDAIVSEKAVHRFCGDLCADLY